MSSKVPSNQKGKIVVVRKSNPQKLQWKKKLGTRRSMAVGIRKAGGLPSFPRRIQSTGNEAYPDNVEPQHHDEDDDFDLPSDTMLAIQSLQQQSQGLFIPFLGNGGHAVQVLLEHQIFATFQENHASNTFSEIRALTRSNTIREITCPGVANTPAYMLTKDYVQAVWDAHNHHSSQSDPSYEPIVSWFLVHLNVMFNKKLSYSDMEEVWEDDLRLLPTSQNATSNPAVPAVATAAAAQSRIVSLENAIRYLCRIQVLLRDASDLANSNNNPDGESYHLWLPNWGLVLKHWADARTMLLGVIARAPRQELSERNVLKKNRSNNISSKFLLEDLKRHDFIRTVERPFGTFVQRIKK